MAELDDRIEEVVLDIERHAAAAGWDQPASLYALVDTADLLQREPQLAEVLGVGDAEPGALTPVEQEAVSDNLHDFLARIAWPEEVTGCAVVLEATTEREVAAQDDGEARIVAAVLRTGETACAIRQRAHDQDDLVLVGPDLVPGLLQLLHATLDPAPGDDADHDPSSEPPR